MVPGQRFKIIEKKIVLILLPLKTHGEDQVNLGFRSAEKVLAIPFESHKTEKRLQKMFAHCTEVFQNLHLTKSLLHYAKTRNPVYRPMGRPFPT